MTRPNADELFQMRDKAHCAIIALAKAMLSNKDIEEYDRILRFLVEFSVACKSCTRRRVNEKSWEYLSKKIGDLLEEYAALTVANPLPIPHDQDGFFETDLVDLEDKLAD